MSTDSYSELATMRFLGRGDDSVSEISIMGHRLDMQIFLFAKVSYALSYGVTVTHGRAQNRRRLGTFMDANSGVKNSNAVVRNVADTM